jgi:hypothetical protein
MIFHCSSIHDLVKVWDNYFFLNLKCMYKSLKYYYYKQYKFFLRINGKDDLPQHTAMLSFAQNIIMNLNALYLIIGSLIFKPFTYFDFSSSINSLKVIICIVLFTLPFYFVFIYRNKYLKIIDEFKNESNQERTNGNRYVIIYSICSLVFQISGFIVLAYNR